MIYETISSLHNGLVKKVAQLTTSKSFRDKEKLTVVEGKNLLTDLLKVKPASMLFVTEENLREAGPCDRLFLVTKEVMKKMTSVEAPEGMLALFPILTSALEKIESPLLILDGLQDPGNVGTLLRTASAFHVSHCVAIEPCCDLWHPKVMRSAKGAHYFFSSLSLSTWEELLPFLQKKQVSLLVADLKGIPIQALKVPHTWALVIGSEAHGPTIPTGALATYFTIPMRSTIDSLNAAQAGAIALYYCTV